MEGYWKENKKQSYQDFVDMCVKLFEKRFGRRPTIGCCHKDFTPAIDGVIFQPRMVNINELLLGEV